MNEIKESIEEESRNRNEMETTIMDVLHEGNEKLESGMAQERQERHFNEEKLISLFDKSLSISQFNESN